MVSRETPNKVGPLPTVMTIDEPMTSDAVMIPMVMRLMVLSRRSPKAIEPFEVKIDAHAATPRVLDQAREVTRHRREKTKRVRKSGLATAYRHARLIPLRECAVEEQLDTVDEPELWVKLTAEALQADQRLEHQREVGR